MTKQQLRIYQLNDSLAQFTDLMGSSTIDELKAHLLDGKDYTCPQCNGSGTIDTNTVVCPTCDGDGKTQVQYTKVALGYKYEPATGPI